MGFLDRGSLGLIIQDTLRGGIRPHFLLIFVLKRLDRRFFSFALGFFPQTEIDSCQCDVGGGEIGRLLHYLFEQGGRVR